MSLRASSGDIGIVTFQASVTFVTIESRFAWTNTKVITLSAVGALIFAVTDGAALSRVEAIRIDDAGPTLEVINQPQHIPLDGCGHIYKARTLPGSVVTHEGS